ncbi:nuclear transport factor 2 family protein [uncultured Jannaschia sp.]|uniref:nuclear transport factor 2 family protein n=1 Tax=uncultured Jannaschia sp. TaxID=293347 RepID=UPI0026141433|nr:nuclear transport factor 2 family protein [uncultured Jannaschia sp.]
MTAAETDLRDVAQRYCEGVYHARPEIFEEICHDRFAMTEITPEGGENAWDKASYLERVRGRSAFPGDVSAEILDVDIAGDEIARVHLWVDVPPRRYEDHLGFVRVDGSWKLLTKVFRTMGPSTVEA